MREILFRAKCFDNGEWVYGVPIKKALIGSHDGYYPKIIPECDGRHQTVYSTAIKEETLGQYTGLTDKNKTGIFENDILSAHPDELFPNDEIRLMVVWHDYGWFGKDSKGGFISLESKWVNELFEVVGNKFDNPELLKGSAKNE